MYASFRLLLFSISTLVQSQYSPEICDPVPPLDQIRSLDLHHRVPYTPNSRRRAQPSLPPFNPFGNLLQITSPPPPNEKQWVMVAGNESQVDGILAASLAMGGRLVSIGFFNLQQQVNYYAIMHQYVGPVFIKPSPMSIDDLMKNARENELRDLSLTQVCGHETGGVVTYNTYWEYVPGVEQQLWFPGTPNAEKQRQYFESSGLRLTFLCGFEAKGEPRYVGVWHNSKDKKPYEAHYGLPLETCLTKNEDLARRNYVAIVFSVFQLGAKLLCTGIWEYAPGHKHFIRVSTDIAQMHSEFIPTPTILPRQISHYLSGPSTVQYVVLWNDLNSRRYPNPPNLWSINASIPSSLLRGSSSLLRPHQLNFVTHRIEYFMRSYDLPALSIAIAKDERLKFAAAYGYTDLRGREQAQPESLFRVGSVSKPITAAAVLMLVDKGLVDLDRPVFGPGTVLGMDYATAAGYGKYVELVTTRMLLEHTTGGWDNDENDPAWSLPKASVHVLCRTVLADPLPGPPGHKWVYSNFGYLLLGQIIEKVTKLTYEDFVYSAVLQPSGAIDAFVARGTIAERRPRESLYYMSGNSIGFDPYDMLPPERIGPWGGWVSNPIQLLKFLSNVDGSNVRGDLISRRAVIEWAIPSLPSNRTYGLGWSINVMGFNGWQHDGRMPGASAMLVRLASGHSMAVTTNKEFIARDFFQDMAYLLHHIVHQCDWWNDLNDLFPNT